jgi:hypothetical protein
MQFSRITVEDPEQAKIARDRYMAAARRSRSAMDRALVRADFKECFLRMTSWNHTAIMAGEFGYTRDRVKTAAGTARIEFPSNTFPVGDLPRGWFDVHRAPVPLIPPHLRPADAYRNYFILWEVKEWKRVAPVDPLLLTHITGHVYAVVAQWDLTPIERAIMNAALARGN